MTWGASQYGDAAGIGATTLIAFDTTFTGGGNVSLDTAGSGLGGGGGGDRWLGGYRAGATGGSGVARYRFRSY